MVKENIRRLMGLQKRLSGVQTNGSSSNKRSETQHTGFGLEKPTADSYYISWLEEHPSALRCFHLMMSATKGKQIVLFLDYDGTLSPIVNDPNRAFMTDRMRSAVREVAKHFPTAIISGRSREKVYDFVKLDEVYYAGSHGMDIVGPPTNTKSYDDKYQINTLNEKGNEFTIYQPAKEYLPSIKKDYGMLEEIIQDVLSEYPCFHLTRGKKVMEIRPSIKWNKGDALVYLLDTLGFSDSTNVLPIYIGDDRTDEDAFKVLRSREEGFPIIVSSVPRQTSASYSLLDPSEVLSFLIHLARWAEAFP
ncbi:probable trehalose-phosphate phosphatase D isoform X2 [Primulina huaijiensis]|uniref:probable trehalose-phosphate phosphatase D isoform X2 n=1 Tax=Primulina huaijiensis TaxID=1492673 RepID=UPI003CC7185A